jgi:hypothetical protein
MKLASLLIVALALSQAAYAQTATLRGQVADQSGAIIPGAIITLTGPEALSKTAKAANDGSYSFTDLPPGNYTVQASAPQLALLQAAKISLKAGAQTLNLKLSVALTKEQVTVEDTAGPSVSTEAANNASAIVLRGTDLEALPDSPDDLAEALQALAGPSAGPNGGSIFIDGFSGGQLPPKESIREIRINQNPFSPEYDRLGLGRIEIFTKPGTDKFRGSIGYNFADDFWNSRNAYAAEKAPFHLNELSGTLSGPLNKRVSFNLNLQREWVDNGSIINAVTLDPQTLIAGRFTDVNLAAQRRTVITPRVDYQLNANHTLTLRYAFNRDDVQNAGIGSLNLSSRGYHLDNRSQTLQITETAVLSTSAINETRFQYFRPTSALNANNTGAAIQVLSAFTGGGAQVGHSIDTQNNYEIQNYTSIARGRHSWRFGARLRGATDASTSPQNFGGTFTFGGGLAPQLDAKNRPVLDASGQPVLVNIDSIERYRRTLQFQQQGIEAAQIRNLGGGATQFTLNVGNPSISAGQIDVGVFAGDDWKVRPNLTLNVGLRYETQTNIHDSRDFAPRIGLAWAPGAKAGRSRPKNVIRAGFGMFYDRFGLAGTLAAERFNGTVEQQYVVTNPDFFPTVPPIASLAGPVPVSTIQTLSSTLRAPYIMQSAAAFERQLPFNTTVALTFTNSHGVHLLRSENINAPQPGTWSPESGGGLFPLGRPGAVFLGESTGLYNQNQIIVNVNSRMNRNVSLTGSYVYNRANSDTDGLGTFPARPYSMQGEYGPAATDMHHRISLTGSIATKWGIRLSPLLTANSGPPFDITVGHDLYGSTLFNGRPGIATSASKPGVIATNYGLLDPNPTPDEKLLPRNFGRGPGQVMLNMRVGKTFAFGSRREGADAASAGPPGGGGNRGGPTSPFAVGGSAAQAGGPPAARRYTLAFNMYIRDVTNHNNPGPIIGNITSPLFGQANQPAGSGGGVFSEAANNRRLELQTRFTF